MFVQNCIAALRSALRGSLQTFTGIGIVFRKSIERVPEMSQAMCGSKLFRGSHIYAKELG